MIHKNEQRQSLVEVLRIRAGEHPDRCLFTYLVDGERDERRMTYADLDRQARSIAAHLQRRCTPGDRALLLYPAGLEFAAAWFGCLYAGVVAVPAFSLAVPRAVPRVRSMCADCRPALALTTASELPLVSAWTAEFPRSADAPAALATDTLADEAEAWSELDAGGDTLAFLQYTSGSTALPKGVVVTHGNLLHNLAVLAETVPMAEGSVMVSWLPHHHDMGLVANFLLPAYTGGCSIVMSPAHFLQRPVRWLQAITRCRGEISPAPNFAYDLCAREITAEQRDQLDLSSWRFAGSGAETIRWEALDRFAEYFAPAGLRREALTTCYGLAENTLVVSMGAQGTSPRLFSVEASALGDGRVVEVEETTPGARRLVGCGRVCPGVRVEIVDPETGRECAPGRIGEIWVRGGSVAKGYWNRPGETRETFEGRIADTGEGPFLRTGDLGFLKDGELVVTGRIKEIIIVHGFNHYPQDIERTAEAAHPALRPQAGAAFAIEVGGEERLVVTHEVTRESAGAVNVDEVAAAVRRAVSAEHGLPVYAVVLLEPDALPRTLSNKVQRGMCRQGFLEGSLKTLGLSIVDPASEAAERTERTLPFRAASAPASAARVTYERIRDLLVLEIARALGVDASAVDIHEPFASLGLKSIMAVQLAGALETLLGHTVPFTAAYDHPSVDALAHWLADGSPAVAPAARPSTRTCCEPVAIVGMACRFPGARSIEEFWQLLRNGADAVREVPEDRWHADAVYDPNPATPHKTNTKWGGFLDDVDQFDAAFFGVSPREAASMDPQQRLLMEVSWEALENAGLAPDRLAGSPTGVFVGIGSIDYIQRQLLKGCDDDAYTASGNAQSIAANRLSYFYDFRGPSLSLDTACSAALVAVHQACRSLRAGECSLALAGAVSLILSPLGTISLSQARMLSSEGRCRAYDARADGYVRSEGCGLVVLKRLSDAVADGDSILIVIRGTAFNHDGRSNGLTAPNTLAQQAVMRAALEDAGVAPAAIGYVEAHGTGTPVGDPIEFESIKGVLLEGRAPDAPCLFGSVKTNIGHLEIAAGIAGLIKTVLALQHEEIPAHLHLDELNPLIKMDGLPLAIPTSRTPWPRGGQQRFAGVSAFGFGGANAHVVVEEGPPHAEPPVRAAADRPRHVLTLSARSTEALRELAGRYAAWLAEHSGVRLADLCHTANTGRAAFPHRLAVVTEPEQSAEAIPVLRRHLAAYAGGEHPSDIVSGHAPRGAQPTLAFLFTGQGAQHVGMGRDLYEAEPVFRETLDRCSAILGQYLEGPLLAVLYPEDGTGDGTLDQTAYTQPALFAIEYALAAMWRSWGVEPDILLGHSVGEIAAACFAGVFSLEDGLRLVAERGRLLQSLPPDGAMTAVFADRATVDALMSRCDGRLSLAAANGPDLHVLSGKRDAVAEAVKGLEAREVRTKAIQVSHAFHSPLVEPILDEFMSVAAAISYHPLRMPLVSNRDGRVMAPGEVPDAAYWREHVRNCVEFEAGMRALAARQCGVFIEIGPGSTLIGMGRRCIDAKDVAWLPSLGKPRDDWRVLSSSLADAYVKGVSVDWHAFDRPYVRRRIALPTYPFQRKRHWFTVGHQTLESLGLSNIPGEEGGFTRSSARHDSQGLHPERSEESGMSQESGKNEILRFAQDDDKGIEAWFHQVKWVEAAAPRAEAAPGSWVIFADDGGLGKRLAAALASRGHECILVARGGAYSGLGAVCTVDPLNFEQVHLLVRDVFSRDGLPCLGLVDLRHLDLAVTPEMPGDALSAALTMGSGGTLYLIQAMMRHAPKDASARLFIVTRSAQRLPGDDTPPDPAQAPAWGLGRTAAIEAPDLAGKLIDLQAAPREDDTDTLADEILRAGPERMVALRPNGRFAARLVRVPPAEGRQRLSCRPDGAYLLTGGLGGLGGVVARWLVAHGARRLILMGRTALPPRAEWPNVRPDGVIGERIALVKDLERLGASVHLAAVDVGDEQALRGFLHTYSEEQWPAIRGVIHMAGVLQDQSLAQMDVASFGVVFRSKVMGAWHLHRALADAPLDFFVLFSSAASLLGAAGQGNYAAANAFLDALAQFRAAQGLPALSINWGPWAEVGMTAGSGRGVRMARQGMNSIDPKQGAAALGVALEQGLPQVGVLNADWAKLAEAFRSAAASPFLSEMGVAPVAAEVSETATRIQTVSGQEREALILDRLRKAVAGVLGTDVEDVPVDQNVVSLGLDSIMAMDLIRVLSRDIQFRVHPREVFEEPSLGALAAHIAVEFDIQQRKREADAPPEDGYLKAHLRKVMKTVSTPRRAERRNPACVFLFAAPRSGSTLLRVMLSAHPGLFSPPELHLLGYNDMADRHAAVGNGKYLGTGVERAFMELRRMDAEACGALVAEMVKNRTATQEVYRMMQEEAHPRILVDKSPSYSGVIEVLRLAEEWFETPKYIYLCRHPYASIESYVRNRTGRMFDFGHAEPYLLAEEVWAAHNDNIMTFLETIGAARQFRVRFEELVCEPEPCMRRMCAWLGLPFDSAMLFPYEKGTMLDGLRPNWQATGDPNFLQHTSIDPDLADAWRQVTLPHPLGEFARRVARALHYDMPAEEAGAVSRTPLDAEAFEVKRL